MRLVGGSVLRSGWPPRAPILGLAAALLAAWPVAAVSPAPTAAAVPAPSAMSPAPAQQSAQEPAPVRVVRAGGEVVSMGPGIHHGYTAVPARSLEPLGWRVEPGDGPAWHLRHQGGTVLEMVPGSPFFRWGGVVRHLADPPYVRDGALWVPAQLVLDFLPFHLPDEYRLAWAGDAPRLEVLGDPEPLVVVIDPGHGGRDLGAVGPGGSREKDVALALGRALARALEGRPGLEVHLTRDADRLVPLWRRGEWATEVKGERSGVFISLHANAMADRGTRGFETYFLSEARTEHERRVAAIENEPLDLGGDDAPPDGDLGFILNELRNHDHQHWSAALADLVQQRLGPVHPGPDRGVKQGPFAVITNALMPAVLVEVGFMSNREEERLLGRSAFHDDVAAALAEAVVEFSRRYPPGRSGSPDPGGPSGPAP